MKDFGRVRSTHKPEATVIDEYSVWAHSDFTEVSENIGSENEFNGWEYHMIQYDKDEFILMQASENAALAQQVTDTQLALCEVYEMLEG